MSTPPSPPPARPFPGWSGATPGERSDAMHRFAAVLAEQRRRLRLRRVAAVRQAAQAHHRVRRAGHHRQHRLLRGRRPPPGGQGPPGEYSGDHTSYVRREPIGVVGSIAPWNYPLQMAAWKILPAIAAGNTIVLKPAELTPLTSLMFAQAATEAGIPDGVINIVTGAGKDAGEHLVGHPDVAMTSFTGSTARRQAGRRDRHRHRQAAPPRTRRQGPLRGLRRRRPRSRRQRRGRRRADQHRPGLHRRHPRLRPAPALRRLRPRASPS